MPGTYPIHHLRFLSRCAAGALLAFGCAVPLLAQEGEEELEEDIAYSTAATPQASLTSGQTLVCEARSADGNGRWPCRFRTTRYVPANGDYVGEVTWTSLGSVHEVRGKLSGTKLTFVEARAIRSGSAHLDVAYDLRVAATAVSGSWRDPEDGSTGSMSITLPKAKAAPAPAPSVGLANGVNHPCAARSADGGRTWPCRVKFTRHDAASGRVTGELTWTGLNSVHVIEGQLISGRLTFTEVRAIRAGGAHLKVTYDMRISGRNAAGTWRDPADGSRGSMSIDLSR